MIRESLIDDPVLEREAFTAYAQQLHDQLYGGEAGSIWCDESAWLALSSEDQDAVWRAGMINTAKLSLTSMQAMMTRTGSAYGRPVTEEEMVGFQETINNYTSALHQAETRRDQAATTI